MFGLGPAARSFQAAGRLSSPAVQPPPARRRRLWLALGTVVLAGLAATVLLLTPAVQGWLIRRTVAQQTGWRLDFTRFGAGPTGVELEGLDFAMPGIRASSAPIAIRIAPGRLFNRREIAIARLEARRLRLTLTPAELAASGPAEPFSGLFSLLQPPLAWGVDVVDLEGEIAVVQGGESLVVGTFSLQGGGLSAASAGEFTYELVVNSALLPPGPENKVRSHGKIRLTQGSDHRLTAVNLQGQLQLPRYGGLALPAATLAVDAAATPQGEDYRLRIEFERDSSVEFTGALDAARARIAGRTTVQVSPTLVAHAAGPGLPALRSSATLDLALDLRRNDLEAQLRGELDARDWTRVDPRLAVLGAGRGEFGAVAERRAGALTVREATATFQPENSPGRIELALSQPLPLPTIPTLPLATLRLENIPLVWANPWLARSGLSLEADGLSGAWQLSVDSERRTLHLAPAAPLTARDVQLRGENLPRHEPVTFAASPRLSLSRTQATLQVDDLVLSTVATDRISVALAAAYDVGAARADLRGELSGSLPSLLAHADRAAPFTCHARWEGSFSARQIRLGTLDFSARSDAPTPCLAFQLLQPLQLDPAQLTVPTTAAHGDLARLTFAHLPIDWISRWLAPRELAGTVTAGESFLRAAPDGRLSFETPVPWRLDRARFGVGGRIFFDGEARVAPTVAFHADRLSAEFRELNATHRDGSTVSGSVTAELHLKDLKGSTALELYADLPALPHSAETFGPLYAALRLKSHNDTRTIAIVDELWFRLLSRDREILLLEAPAPFVGGKSNSGAVNIATSAPLKLTTGEFPLAWLRPWITGVELDGALQAGEFLLFADMSKFRLRPVKPVHVRGFSARVGPRLLARDTDFSGFPGADLTVMCLLEPTFQFAFLGAAHLTNGSVLVAGQPAIDLDLSLGFIGNDQLAYPNRLDLSLRADFAQLSRIPALAATGLPRSGTWVARANGGLLEKTPLQFWTRLEGIPTADGKRLLAPMELLGQGLVSSRQRAVTAEMQLFLDTAPRVSDAYFEVKLNLGAGTLETASRFESHFFDAGEVFALVDVIQANRPAPVAASTTAAPAGPTADATPPPPADAGPAAEPLWAGLRGKFDLDLATLRFAPYQIEQVRGRLAFTNREFTLSDLHGEMFAGRWHGHARLRFDPHAVVADHDLEGEFHIEQFDSARIVQTVFPTELASVDARIDVRSRVRSRGFGLLELVDRAEADFTVEGRQGIVRLNVPKQDFASTAAVFGGTLLLSPELRALGRLLKKFSEMPVDQLRISGARSEEGEVRLHEFMLDSPQARLLARGRIPHVPGAPLMDRPLELSVDLAARDEMAVILGGMSLLESAPRGDGYRPLKETFELRGKAGEPDTRPLYDLLAKAVLGSKGTWGFLMRKVQDQMKPVPTATPKPPASGP